MKYIVGLLVLLAVWYFWPAKKEAPPAPVVQTNGPAGLSQEELAYHEQVFFYTLDHMADGQGYDWKTYSASGRVTAQKPFTSKSGYYCRAFEESYSIAGQNSGDKGIACKRQGRDGWCRLKETQALTCALELPADPSLNMAGQQVTIPGVNVGGRGAGGSGADGPDVNVNAPHVESPFDAKAPGNEKPGQGYADTVTGTAGRAAGPATAGFIEWFGETFR